MADKAHRLTDEKLEEMESGCLPFIPERKRKSKRQRTNTFPNLPNKMGLSGSFWSKEKSQRKNMQNGALADEIIDEIFNNTLFIMDCGKAEF